MDITEQGRMGMGAVSEEGDGKYKEGELSLSAGCGQRLLGAEKH